MTSNNPMMMSQAGIGQPKNAGMAARMSAMEAAVPTSLQPIVRQVMNQFGGAPAGANQRSAGGNNDDGSPTSSHYARSATLYGRCQKSFNPE